MILLTLSLWVLEATNYTSYIININFLREPPYSSVKQKNLVQLKLLLPIDGVMEFRLVFFI